VVIWLGLAEWQKKQLHILLVKFQLREKSLGFTVKVEGYEKKTLYDFPVCKLGVTGHSLQILQISEI